MAAIDEPRVTEHVSLQLQGLGHQIAGPWKNWPTETGIEPRVQHREVRVSGLLPGQTYSTSLAANGLVAANAVVRTLPVAVPVLGEKPFTVLLGSCFAYHEDRERKLGNAYFHMPHSASPDIKIFAGDQVYLDSPWYRYLVPHTRQQLAEAFLEHYTSTWAQAEGFARLLADGPNYFSSDDHEFWNNAPNPGAYAVNTWDSRGRSTWLDAARGLYSTFQTPEAITSFSVPPLSFFLADTRINRDQDRNNFMKTSDLERLEDWIHGLAGPGILVLGQPLLQTTTGFLKGSFGDWNLPDFKQYSRLVRVIGESQHTMLVLTGDVHYGRIARSTLRSGRELIELISSPMSLVDEKARGSWAKAPSRFPSAPPNGTTPASLARSDVSTEAGFAPTDRHFLTIEFTRRGPGAHLELRFWPVFDGGIPPPEFGRKIWERDLA
jgi:hypothetical protein